jgi:hypothetical protein
MFTKSSRIVVVAATMTLSAFVASAAPLTTARPKVTVGEFAVKVSRALGYPVDDPEAASDTLRMTGVHIDADLGAPLTRGRAADMMRDMGLPSTVSGDPAGMMSPTAADRAATSVALAAATMPPEVSTTQVTESCASVGDRTSCYACCTSILSPKVRHPITAIIICALLCSRLYPPPSPSSFGR